MEIKRAKTRVTDIGGIKIGGNNPIAIQSMTNTKTSDISSTVSQILSLENAGCDIVRCAVPDMESALAISGIKKKIHIPLVADIHFDHRLAIAAVENGADKIRINPGNIGGKENIAEVVRSCKMRSVPIRVGVNSGSLEKKFIEKYNGVTAQGLAESALEKAALIENIGYDNLVISIKSSNVPICIDAYRIVSGLSDHPLHIGITEAGTYVQGNIKSAVGLGIMLSQGIGDTMRVSLTGDPVEEIRSAKLILRTLEIEKGGIEIVSCPTCGRTGIDLIELCGKVEKLCTGYDHLNIKIAVMGCAVNGPGEAREAELGIAGGKGEGLIFRRGEIIKKVPEDKLLEAFEEELSHYTQI